MLTRCSRRRSEQDHWCAGNPGALTAPAFATAISAGLVVLLLNATPSRAVGQATFELTPPPGRYQVATTAWRLTDNSRKETFSESSELRQVEVLAWYPAAAARRGALAPYLREGLSEVRIFATLLRGPGTAFDELANVPTHAEPG